MPSLLLTASITIFVFMTAVFVLAWRLRNNGIVDIAWGLGFIVVTTDKGLCGGLNTNVLRQVLNAHKDWTAKGIDVEASLKSPFRQMLKPDIILSAFAISVSASRPSSG